jgi:beta-glucanase (GH16 family)
MKSIVLLGPCIALLGFLCAVEVDAQAWALVWADEFDGGALDTTRWEAQLGDGCPGLCGWGNNELEWYQAENATVEAGFLTITAKEEEAGGRSYTSARIRTRTRGDWTYGRFVIRARLPIGKGIWPAIWMLPTDPSIYGTWAASGEIDIMEYVGDKPTEVLGTLHYGGSWPDNQYTTNTYTQDSGRFDEDFHEFALEWEPDSIRWYVDDVLYATQTSWFSTGGAFPAPFDVDFHLILNVAVGGNLPDNPDATTVFPQALVVDYARVYQVNPGGTSTQGDLGELPDASIQNTLYPNPVDRAGYLELRPARTGPVRVEVYDLLGRRRALLFDGMLPGNAPHRLQLDGSELPDGRYLYRIFGQAVAESRRFIVRH